jgi:hypothetical protein
MTGSDERDAWVEAELRSLDSGARDVLAALAVCGRAALTVDQLSEITGLFELPPTLADLERRGLVVRDGDRYSLAPPTQGPLKRWLASVDVVDRVLRGFIRIAEDGRLTLDDLDAIVELTGIAAETQHWRELIRLADAAETTLSTKHRVEEWIKIAERRGEARCALENEQAIRRAEEEPARRGAREPQGGSARLALSALAAAVFGVAAGYLIGNGSGDGTQTVTEAGAPGPGATETVTETAAAETETVTETTTVEITVEAPPPTVD